MKKTINFLLSILTVFSMMLFSFNVSASCIENPYSQFSDDPYYELTQKSINDLVSKLANLPASGSVCIDYLSEEILLHRAILLATNNIVSYSNNPELIDISDDIVDSYTGELKEMRIELSRLVETFGKEKQEFKEDAEYIKQVKPIVENLQKELSNIKSSNSNEITYINQAIALLKASYEISLLDNKCAKSDLVKKISKIEVENTQEYISRLKTLEEALK